MITNLSLNFTLRFRKSNIQQKIFEMERNHSKKKLNHEQEYSNNADFMKKYLLWLDVNFD